MGSNQILSRTQSTLIVLSKSDLKADEKRFLLKVQGDGKEYYYWIGRRTWLGELLMDYTRRVGISINSTKLVCNGKDLSPFALCSADDLNLKDGDSIDVIRKDEYEHRVPKGSESTLISLPRAQGEIPIYLKLECMGSDGNLYYQIGRNTPLEIAFRDYSDRTFRFYDCTKFSNSRIGSRSDLKKTAGDLGLEDGDIIRAETSFESLSCVIM